MRRRTGTRGSMGLLLVIVAAMAAGCCMKRPAGCTDGSNRFETVREHIQAWLSETSADDLLISASRLKETILDDWNNQSDTYDIVSVRRPDDYRAGHIPHAANIYWIDIVKDESLSRLDADKTLVLYCYFGHGSMLSSTILNLLGYRCVSLNFGMMGWNLDALVKEPWDQKADYEVETTARRSNASYPLPVIASAQSDARSIIREMARTYLSGEGSPVILSSDVKAIIDDWDHKGMEYQIVDVRSKREYEAGHVPHAINIPWSHIARIRNLRKLDPNKNTVVCSENGQTGQMATTVLALLGYRAVDMKFGMMDWNSRYVEGSERWAGAAGYPLEVPPRALEPR